MNFILMQISPETIAQAIKASDELSSKSDRWLFIFTLICLCISAVLVIKYMVSSIEKLQTKYDAVTERFMEIIGDQNKVQTEFAVKLNNNTTAMERNTEALTINASIISDLRRKTDNLTAALTRHNPA